MGISNHNILFSINYFILTVTGGVQERTVGKDCSQPYCQPKEMRKCQFTFYKETNVNEPSFNIPAKQPLQSE